MLGFIDFLKVNAGTIVVGLIVLGLAAVVVGRWIVKKKKGESPLGCSGCSGCSGNGTCHETVHQQHNPN